MLHCYVCIDRIFLCIYLHRVSRTVLYHQLHLQPTRHSLLDWFVSIILIGFNNDLSCSTLFCGVPTFVSNYNQRWCALYHEFQHRPCIQGPGQDLPLVQGGEKGEDVSSCSCYKHSYILLDCQRTFPWLFRIKQCSSFFVVHAHCTPFLGCTSDQFSPSGYIIWNDLVNSSLGSIVGTANTTARRHVWQHYQCVCHVWSLADRLQFGLGGNSPAFHEHRRRSACRRTTIYLIFDDFLLGFVKMVLFIAFLDCSRWVDAPGVSNFWKYPIFDWEKNYLPLRTN